MTANRTGRPKMDMLSDIPESDRPPSGDWVQVDDDFGFLKLVGPIWEHDPGDGRPPIVGFRAAERHKNLNGVVQGGMLMTLADRGMGRIARRENGWKPVATVHFSYDFLAAAEIGRFVELHPRIDHMTGSLIFMDSRLLCEGEVLGRANGVWKRLKRG